MTDTTDRHLHVVENGDDDEWLATREVGNMGFSDCATSLEVLAGDDGWVHATVFPRPWDPEDRVPSAMLDMPPWQARRLADWLNQAAELAEQRREKNYR
ncbi:hypothetical protein ACTXG5_22890 [Mycobacterium sp. Dal123C01]|uniref:hypothetical protein n=1 Tax=Mycobacterium sp. Dal123C01 TaxID=3457577 RepID=UPI00403E9F87